MTKTDEHGPRMLEEHILKVDSGQAGNRLDAVLALIFGGYGLRARRRLWEWCAVTVDGVERKPAYKVRAGQVVVVRPLAGMPGESGRHGFRPRDFSVFIPAVVAANEDFVAFRKPEGMPSAALAGGGGLSMEALIAAHWPLIWQRHLEALPGGSAAAGDSPAQPLLCNRLDTPTSGLLLAAFSGEKLDFFRQCERAGKVRKKYLVMAHGITPEYLLLDKALDAYRRKTTLVLPHADRDYTRHSRAVRLKTFETPEQMLAGEGGAAPPAGDFDPASDVSLGYAAGLGRDDASMAGLMYLVGLTGPLSLLEVTIMRGARHQIRAHLAGYGFPIVGDTQYGLESTSRGGRLYLHHSEINLPGFRAGALPDWSLITR